MVNIEDILNFEKYCIVTSAPRRSGKCDLVAWSPSGYFMSLNVFKLKLADPNHFYQLNNNGCIPMIFGTAEEALTQLRKLANDKITAGEKKKFYNTVYVRKIVGSVDWEVA